MAVMDSFLITVDGSEHEVSTGTVRRLLDTSARFWLDLAGVDKSTADGLLRDTFGFHPLAVQDAEHFGQRPKIDAYDDVTLMVVYGRPAAAGWSRCTAFTPRTTWSPSTAMRARS
jgi:Mg2+ and Co2+ transporter CorA